MWTKGVRGGECGVEQGGERANEGAHEGVCVAS